MASEDVINSGDVLLRSIPNVKICKPQSGPDDKPTTKEQLQHLRLSRKIQENVMETLKFIHGKDFTLSEASDYKDKGRSITNKYWVGSGNLVIKGCYDYSNSSKEPDSEIERLKMFAAMRLESYGFHKEHCQEALDYCNGEIEESLGLLYEKYLKLKGDCRELMEPSIEMSEDDLLQQRVDEKGVLESIYEDSFAEKVKNSVWIITMKLDYLVNFYHKKQPPTPTNHTAPKKNSKRKTEKCRYYLQNRTCKYGNKCRFAHVDDRAPDINDHLTNFKFELEVRFPSGTKYPLEAPIIFLKTDAVLPHLIPLHICKRLHQEAVLLAGDGMPSIYSVCELLKNEDEIMTFMQQNVVDFLQPHESLVPKDIPIINYKNRPTHFKKGVTNRDNQREYSKAQVKRENVRIYQQHQSKASNNVYRKMQGIRGKLPAAAFKENILNCLHSSQVVVISGETGCGKSTQVPQFILDEWLDEFDPKDAKHVEIVCTQPRRISAIGVAERVADERVEKVGNTVGYQIRLENKISASTRLTFCTTGILLRRLEMDPTLLTVTHIIVDEVHERSEDSDFILLIIRDLLPLRPDLKVILMSATLNANVFSNYFHNVPVLEIPGRTHPVKQIFLEDLLEMSDYVFEEGSQYARSVKDKNVELEVATGEARLSRKPKNIVKDENLKFSELSARYEGCSARTCRTLYLMDSEKMNLDLIESTLVWIAQGSHEYPKMGTILVFLPGIAEITALYDQLSCHPEFSPKSGKFLLVPLHSSLSSSEQALVFEKPKDKNVRKIVLSTNIAETSITIEDCIFVIDSGKMKEKHFDSNRNMESLETVWVSRANAQQRKGRAGRVMSGVCIHLYTSHRFNHNILGQPIPEIHRVPLERLVLNIKVLPNFTNAEVHDVLGKIIEPPTKESIDSSIIRLQHVGAIDRDNNLTPLGHHLAALPVDVRIGKLMLFGAIFSCIDSALTMAACLSYKTPFIVPFGQKDKANAKRQKFATGLSDQMTVLTAYNKFQEANRKGFYAGLNFAKENCLSHKTLETISDVKFQFLELLVSIGFVPINITRRPKSGTDNILQLTGPQLNTNGSNNRVLASVLCAALYPNVVKVLQPEKKFVLGIGGAVAKDLVSKDFKFRTKQEQVFLHPSSITFELKYFPSPFMVYQEKVKTSKVFIRDCCVVPVIPLLLFTGYELNISVHKGVTYLVLDDNWIMFESEEHKVAEMLKMIRIELLDLLEEKIKDPLLNLQSNAKSERVITTILQLVTDE